MAARQDEQTCVGHLPGEFYGVFGSDQVLVADDEQGGGLDVSDVFVGPVFEVFHAFYILMEHTFEAGRVVVDGEIGVAEMLRHLVEGGVVEAGPEPVICA